jgi:hypothetical protein
MRLLQFLARFLGWLLTPLVASAASFFGAIAGAVLARGIDNPLWGLAASAVCALAAAMVVTALWLRILRRSPEVREALGVDASGVPDTFIPDPTAAPPDEAGSGAPGASQDARP